MVVSSGYTARRARVLGFLYKLGFNQPDANGVSNLAFVNSIMPSVNDGEISRLYRYCREHGIVPDIDTLLPFGRAGRMTSEDIMIIDRVSGELRWFDQTLGIEWPVDSIQTYIGQACDRCFHHLYIDHFGRVSPCLGANKKEVYIGNIRNQQIEKLWRVPLMRNIRARRYGGLCSVCAKFLDGRCNSCLGRFTSRISLGGIETTGCWKFERG
ncbi:TPA: hypothetical protein DEA21_00720 [Candidatus Uhrbacteria bacterium]|nr:hypothetical protein [Candidatus Uhrbacteria bacterium]HCU31216.1 hypothetical protein [Candidatus Uhrbacteria bacterium]